MGLIELDAIGHVLLGLLLQGLPFVIVGIVDLVELTLTWSFPRTNAHRFAWLSSASSPMASMTVSVTRSELRKRLVSSSTLAAKFTASPMTVESKARL